MTLVRARDWHALPHADTLADGDNVWGVAYRIDPAHAEEVRAYLDHREKDGYSIQQVDVCNMRDGQEVVVAEKVRAWSVCIRSEWELTWYNVSGHGVCRPA